VNDAYVAKPNASGTALIYSSYLGGYNGIASEIGYGIAVDGNSTAHVVGYTSTSAFPTTASAFQPSYGGGADDVFFARITNNDAPAPRVTDVVVNDGSVQRSMVTSLTVSFSGAVSFPSGVGSAFVLERVGPGGPTGAVNVSAVQSGIDVTLTFAAGGSVGLDPGASLMDGLYTLSVVANNVQGPGGMLDGNGDGTAGDDYSFNLHRLFGDADGNRTINTADFAAFRTAFGVGASIFDFNNDGQTDTSDFAEFRRRFGMSV